MPLVEYGTLYLKEIVLHGNKQRLSGVTTHITLFEAEKIGNGDHLVGYEIKRDVWNLTGLTLRRIFKDKLITIENRERKLDFLMFNKLVVKSDIGMNENILLEMSITPSGIYYYGPDSKLKNISGEYIITRTIYTSGDKQLPAWIIHEYGKDSEHRFLKETVKRRIKNGEYYILRNGKIKRFTCGDCKYLPECLKGGRYCLALKKIEKEKAIEMIWEVISKWWKIC